MPPSPPYANCVYCYAKKKVFSETFHGKPIKIPITGECSNSNILICSQYHRFDFRQVHRLPWLISSLSSSDSPMKHQLTLRHSFSKPTFIPNTFTVIRLILCSELVTASLNKLKIFALLSVLPTVCCLMYIKWFVHVTGQGP